MVDVVDAATRSRHPLGQHAGKGGDGYFWWTGLPPQVKPWVTAQDYLGKLLAMKTLERALPNESSGLPGWREMPSKPRLYLSLNHGRDFPQQILKTERFAGPKIGPLSYLKTRYAQQVTLGFENQHDADRYFPETRAQKIHFLDILEGTLIFEGKCYGAWDVCYIPSEFCKAPPRKKTQPKR